MKIEATRQFSNWLDGLKDVAGRVRILTRIDRLSMGNPGQHRNLKGGISELKLTIGPGYRIYYMQRNDTLIILLCGGDKSSQANDIRKARRLASNLQEES